MDVSTNHDHAILLSACIKGRTKTPHWHKLRRNNPGETLRYTWPCVLFMDGFRFPYHCVTIMTQLNKIIIDWLMTIFLGPDIKHFSLAFIGFEILLWKIDSGLCRNELGFQIPQETGFQIPEGRFRIPKSWIPDSRGKKILDSGFLYMGRAFISYSYLIEQRCKTKKKVKID